MYTDSMSFESFENIVQTLEMRLSVRTCNKADTSVCVSEVETHEDVIDESLESLCSFFEPKGMSET